MESASLIENDDTAWRVYNTFSFAIKVFLCTFLTPRWLALSGIGIFSLQVVKSALDNNWWIEGLWEYPVSILYITTVYCLTNGNSKGHE